MTHARSILRRAALLLLPALFLLGVGAPLSGAQAQGSSASNVAGQYVTDNIHKGLDILNNKQLSVPQRRSQFEGFLLGLTDMNRIADFTLGQYRRTISPADLTGFESAFQNYAVSVYQSYFSRYAGQSLRVISSQQRAPGDYIVATQLIDANDSSGQQPLEVDFRVRTDHGKPVVVDFSVAGIWLAIEERDQFTSFLGQNGGNVHSLIGHLNDLAKAFR